MHLDKQVPLGVVWESSSIYQLRGKGRVLIFFYPFFFLGPHLWHMEVPRLGVKSKLHLPAYATATATQDPSESATYTTAHCNAGYPTH